MLRAGTLAGNTSVQGRRSASYGRRYDPVGTPCCGVGAARGYTVMDELDPRAALEPSIGTSPPGQPRSLHDGAALAGHGEETAAGGCR